MALAQMGDPRAYTPLSRLRTQHGGPEGAFMTAARTNLLKHLTGATDDPWAAVEELHQSLLRDLPPSALG